MLSAGELGLLARLDLVHRRPARGLYAGERRSPRSARSPEFADFRPYAPGDDFRQVDWRAYARLDRLVLRLYVAEEEACLNVVVDDSASMVVEQKLAAAARLAAGLCFLGMAAMDRVVVGTLSGRRLAPVRGRDGLGRVLPFLGSIEPAAPSGPTELMNAAWTRPGLTVVVSDFLAAAADGGPADWTPAVAALARRRQEVALWQLLSAQEETPGLTGDVKLLDVESDRHLEVTVTRGVLAEYEDALAGLRDSLRRSAAAASGRFLASRSEAGIERWMADALRAGLVRRA